MNALRARMVLAGACIASGAAAQDMTPADAFKAGQAFSRDVKGTNAAAGSVSTGSGSANVPKYNTSPPEAGIFGGGKSFIGAAGSTKQVDCSTYHAASAYEQQECDAVNYLDKLPADRPKFVIDKDTDPLMIKSKDTIGHPGTVPASGTAACHIETTTVPGTYTTEQCERSTILDTIACNKTLVPACGYVGTPIGTHSEDRNGAFLSASLTPAGSPGLYSYLMEVPYRNCGGDGVASINFNLDTIGTGSYVSINLSNLDDAAAIAVNDTTVFAGYPNNGPQYSGAFFPISSRDFQVGYSWSEDVGRDMCIAWDGDGACTKTTYLPNLQAFRADTKLLDFCPGGYAPVSQKSTSSCDLGSGACPVPSGDTSAALPGFFCNAEGKFLMNRHEGDGTWAGAVSSSMPLKAGANRISVYWGTGGSRTTCGNVRVAGQIYNVAPGCSNRWDDQCAPMRAGVK